MNERNQAAAQCRGKCAGGRACACSQGHKAHHICRNPRCTCHQPEAYGLHLDAHTMRYVPDAPPAGVTVLEATA